VDSYKKQESMRRVRAVDLLGKAVVDTKNAESILSDRATYPTVFANPIIQKIGFLNMAFKQLDKDGFDFPVVLLLLLLLLLLLMEETSRDGCFSFSSETSTTTAI
jgi:hypothetical protein